MLLSFRGFNKPLDEGETLVDSIIQYQEAFQMYFNEVTGRHKDLISELGGVPSDLYKNYTKMILLNDTCEKYLSFTV